MSCIPNDKNNYICTDKAICCPYKDFIWNLENNLVTWNMMYPAYGNNSLIDIYFYRKKDYKYYHITNFTGISVGIEYYIVEIDNEWFLNDPLEFGKQRNLNFTIIIVSNNVNPDIELNDKLSNYRNVDFTIIQNGTLQSNTSSILPNPTNSISNGNIDNNYKTNFEIWKIVIIVLGGIIFLVIICFLLYKKKKRIERKNEIENKQINEVITYQKPDEPVYQKVNIK